MTSITGTSRRLALAAVTTATALAVFATVLTTPRLARADDSRAMTGEVGAFGGWLFLSEDNELGNSEDRQSIPDDAVVLGGRLGLNITDRIGLEAEVAYALSSFRNTGNAAGVFGWRGSALYHLLEGNLRPFVLAGYGGEMLVDDQPGVVSDNDAALHLGVGAKYDVSRAVALRGDARYINLAGVDSTTSHNFEVLLGVSITLGMPPEDTDGDGINDLQDRCPKAAEDKDGFEDDDGCPDPDNDGDGVEDKIDQCPEDAEDRDGFEDDNGCPDSDNDRDGIADDGDKCPDKAEDKDGFEDDDGCPDPDNDGDGIADEADKCPTEAGTPAEQGCPVRDRDHDGIADKVDQCPDEAETFNGIKDDDGCPDAKATVIITKSEIKILEKVYFETGKADIKSVSFQLLDTVAAVLNGHAEITSIIIEGHTDDVGKDEKNLALSQARADSVRTYLIDHQVADGRLVAKGFGESAPICAQVEELSKSARKNRKQIAACREENRRVQFKIGSVNGKPVEASDSVTIEREVEVPAE